MNALSLVPKHSTPARPAHLIRVAVPRLNKCDQIGEYLTQLEARDFDLEWAEIAETRQLNCAEWNALMNSLLEDRDWLASKGGTSSWAVTIPDDGRDGWLALSEDERSLFKQTAYLHVVAVVAPTGQTVYIDPQGYNYARYVAFPADGLPGPKTREQIRREEAKAEADRKVAELKARIAAPPPEVPADHGLRFFWNGIKFVNASSRAEQVALFGCRYSNGTPLHYPEGTITIYASDYNHFPEHVAKHFTVENNSDFQSDYFDDDKIRVLPNHPLYSAIKAAFDAQEAHHARKMAKREAKWRQAR